MDEGKPPVPPAGAPDARLQARFDNPDLLPIADHLVNIAEQLRMFKLNGTTQAPSRNPNEGTITRAVPALKGGVSPIEIARYTYLMRRTRNAIFGSPDMFGEPAWDILLDLYIAYAENKPVSVSSACIGSASPPTTGLRWLGVLADNGFVLREHDPEDQRRVLVKLSQKGIDAMNTYFDSAIQRAGRT